MEHFWQQVWIEAHSKSSNNALWKIYSRKWNHPKELNFPLKVNILGENESLNLKIKVRQNLNLSLPWNKTIIDENHLVQFSSVQFSSVAQSCLTLCDPMNHSTPGLPVHHQFPEFTQTHVHRVHDAIQPSHPLSFLFPPAVNPSQHQSLFQWVSASHEVAKVLELQL